jgi:hypothetical protein
MRSRRGEILNGFVGRSVVSSTLDQILNGTGFRIKRLAASRKGLLVKPEHWLARSKTRRQAVYDADRSEDVLNLRRGRPNGFRLRVEYVSV